MRNYARCSAYIIYSVLTIIYEVDIYNLPFTGEKSKAQRGSECGTALGAMLRTFDLEGFLQGSVCVFKR